MGAAMPEEKYAECPDGHEFMTQASAVTIRSMGSTNLEPIVGWLVIWCRRCGHVFAVTPPATAAKVR